MKTVIKPSVVRAIVRSHGKRVSKDFLVALDSHIQRKIEECCAEHNGGKKTLDIAIASYFGIR
jgi:hypothetical protein